MYKRALHHPTGFDGGHYPFKYKMHATTTASTTATTIHISTLQIPNPRRLIHEPSYNRPSKMSSDGTNKNAPATAVASAGDDANRVKGDHKRRVAGAVTPPVLKREQANPKELRKMVEDGKRETAKVGKA